jgi:hypothetical protein
VTLPLPDRPRSKNRAQFPLPSLECSAAYGRKVVALQHLHRVIKAHSFGAHHPQDYVAAFTAGALAVPHVLYRIDVEAGIGLLWKGQRPISSLPLGRRWMPRASASRCTEISRLSRSFTSGGTYGIGSAPSPVFRAPQKNLSRAFCKIFGFLAMDGRYTIVVYTVKEF